jgi:hypothetical protein
MGGNVNLAEMIADFQANPAKYYDYVPYPAGGVREIYCFSYAVL